jgi:hypothetical protein
MNRTKKGSANGTADTAEQTEINTAIFIYGNVHLFHFYQMVDLP